MIPGSVHPCRCSANTGTRGGIGIGHQPPQHPPTLDDACIQLIVDGLPALGLADGDLAGKGRVVTGGTVALFAHDTRPRIYVIAFRTLAEHTRTCAVIIDLQSKTIDS